MVEAEDGGTRFCGCFVGVFLEVFFGPFELGVLEIHAYSFPGLLHEFSEVLVVGSFFEVESLDVVEIFFEFLGEARAEIGSFDAFFQVSDDFGFLLIGDFL